jgi:hypothetical protein
MENIQFSFIYSSVRERFFFSFKSKSDITQIAFCLRYFATTIQKTGKIIIERKKKKKRMVDGSIFVDCAGQHGRRRAVETLYIYFI